MRLIDNYQYLRTHYRRLSAETHLSHRFSLTEIIVAFLLIAVLSAMLVPFFGAALVRSGDPALRLPGTSDLMTVMETINADYENSYHDDLASLKTAIDAGTYGTYTVLNSDYVTFDSAGVEQSGGTTTDTLKVTLRNAAGERLTALFPYQVEP